MDVFLNRGFKLELQLSLGNRNFLKAASSTSIQGLYQKWDKSLLNSIDILKSIEIHVSYGFLDH